MAKEKEVNSEVRPLDDRVVVEPLEAEEKTAGGILLPDTAKQKPQRGRVLAVGPASCSTAASARAVAVSRATRSSTAGTAAPTSKWTARKSRSCARAISWRRS